MSADNYLGPVGPMPGFPRGRNPEFDPDMVSCPECGEDRWCADEPCAHCGAEWGDAT